MALALEFTPTESEWLTWPEYCRARYVVSGAGRDTEFEARVDRLTIADWQSRLGAAWDSLHHYCAGLAITSRAKLEPDKNQKDYLLRRVLDEFRYALIRIPKEHPMHAEVAARTGLIHRDRGESDEALKYFDIAIEACRQCTIGYQAKAMFYRGNGSFNEARKVLEEANAVLGGESSEVHYFLGLVLLDLAEYDAAVKHARIAYSMGYPLPGLKDQLARVGHKLE